MAISLDGVSDQELVSRLRQFVGKEQKLTHRIILHLAEIDRRRLYAELGYTSLFDYCTRGLGYAAGSAQRRIKAARAMRSVPEIYECLADGRLSLAVIETVSDALTGPRARELVNEVCGKGRDEAMKIVARFHPVEPWRLGDRIEPIVVKGNLDADSKYFRAEVRNGVGNSGDAGYRISFTASEELKEKLDRVRELLFGSFGPAKLEPLLEWVVDEYLARHCPRVRGKQRVERKERKAVAKGKRVVAALEEVQQVGREINGGAEDCPESRYVSAALRERILERDGHCCSYEADDGTRCGSRMGLEIDHIVPFAYGGLTEPSNLRAVCRTHNLMWARKIFGDDRIDEIVEQLKRGAAGQPSALERQRDGWADPAEQFFFG